MPDSILPATAIAEELDHAGYTAIGLDHFALPNDPLASAASTGKLRRNFQGYTDDTADALIAFGASAISEFPQGFAQAARDTLAWADAVAHNKPPITLGLATTAEDRMRAGIIDQVMCNFSADFGQIARRFGFDFEVLDDSQQRLQPLVDAGLACVNGSTVRVPK